MNELVESDPITSYDSNHLASLSTTSAKIRYLVLTCRLTYYRASKILGIRPQHARNVAITTPKSDPIMTPEQLEIHLEARKQVVAELSKVLELTHTQHHRALVVLVYDWYKHHFTTVHEHARQKQRAEMEAFKQKLKAKGIDL